MTLPKIEEWIKEIEQRPESAVTLLKLIAGRLRDLTVRNEQILTENIALQDGTRVEDYRRRIAHLEFELDLLKRRFGLDEASLEALAAEPALARLSLLVYNPMGRILRLEAPEGNGKAGQLGGEILSGGEAARLLALPVSEEVLLLFTSGRISTCRVEDIPLPAEEAEWNLDKGSLPDEPHAGERLACLMPLARLPLADFFLQTSRRGCLKKTMTSIAENILSNRFLGRGVVQRLDQPFDMLLCHKQECFALVSREGRLLGLDVDDLSYSVEERIKLDGTDHIVAGFTFKAEDLILCLTQTGKVISKGAASLELQKAPISRGLSLIPESRLAQGIRFIGAGATRPGDRLAVLDEDGNLSLFLQEDIVSAGSVPVGAPLLSFCVLAAAEKRSPKP